MYNDDTHSDVISKFNLAVFIIHVTGKPHKLHQKVLPDKRHNGTQDKRHKQVNVDGVPGAVELPAKEQDHVYVDNFLVGCSTTHNLKCG